MEVKVKSWKVRVTSHPVGNLSHGNSLLAQPRKPGPHIECQGCVVTETKEEEEEEEVGTQMHRHTNVSLRAPVFRVQSGTSEVHVEERRKTEWKKRGEGESRVRSIPRATQRRQQPHRQIKTGAQTATVTDRKESFSQPLGFLLALDASQRDGGKILSAASCFNFSTGLINALPRLVGLFYDRPGGDQTGQGAEDGQLSITSSFLGLKKADGDWKRRERRGEDDTCWYGVLFNLTLIQYLFRDL